MLVLDGREFRSTRAKTFCIAIRVRSVIQPIAALTKPPEVIWDSAER